MVTLAQSSPGDRSARAPQSKTATVMLGRMAFTNYMTQSIILSLIFYGFGFALFGRLSLPQSLAVAAVIYAAQAAFSAWWLGRFRFGPIEWLWRSLMYGGLQRVPAIAHGARHQV